MAKAILLYIVLNSVHDVNSNPTLLVRARPPNVKICVHWLTRLAQQLCQDTSLPPAYRVSDLTVLEQW